MIEIALIEQTVALLRELSIKAITTRKGEREKWKEQNWL